MILKIYGGVEILIDDEDCERVLNILSVNCMWHLSSGSQIHGWCQTKSGKEKLILSRVVMNCFDSNLDVDHIHHNHLDLRKSELRVYSHRNNCLNRPKPKSNTSGYKGVSWSKDKFKWVARIRVRIPYKVKTRKLHLGYFDSAVEAAIAYNNASIMHHKEFALLNII